MKKFLYFSLLIFVVLIFIVSCGSDDSETPPSPPAEDLSPNASDTDPNDDDSAEDLAPTATDTDPNDDTSKEETPLEEPEVARILFTEIMYNPGDEDSPEFLELINTSNDEIDISGYTFTKGIEYTFEAVTVIAPGEIIVLSNIDPDDDDSLEKRLPEDVRLFAPYDGRLSDEGEEIELRDTAGGKVCDITYNDKFPWPVTADGFGHSMVVADPTLSAWGDNGDAWRASALRGGFPGTLTAEEALVAPNVVINEVLTHTDNASGDGIELYNDSAAPVDVSGWYLVDNKNGWYPIDSDDEQEHYIIPRGSIIEPYGYLHFSEDNDGNPDNNDELGDNYFGKSFSLNSHGDEAYVFAVENGELTGYANGYSFGEVENYISFGRYENASGKIQFIAQRAETLGRPNAGPYVGYIVISEIMYHADEDSAPCNFIEITNTSNNAERLFDPDHPENTWQISGAGINFAFPGVGYIESGEYIVLIEQEKMSVDEFRRYYDLDATIKIYGYEGELKRSRDTIEIKKPEDPLENDDGDPIPQHMVVDRAGYDEDNPGLEAADGRGVSIERINLKAYGDDYTNWALSELRGTPGRGR